MNDWLPVCRRARSSLIVLTGVLLFCTGLYLGSAHFRTSLSNRLGQKQAQVSTEQEALNQKQKDLDNIQSHIQQFRQLQEQGLIGTAQREDWVEQLLATRRQLGLPENLTYTLKQPTPVSTNPTPEQTPADTATAAAPDSPMAHNLEFELSQTQEAELIALLKTYESKVRGRFRVQSCRLSEPGANGLTARCTLRFFTIPQIAKPAEST